MKLVNLYNKGLITEAFSQYALNKAMDEKRVISIYYDSPHDTTNDKGWRRIEPMVYGKNKYGNEVLRAWQTGGSSDTPEGKPSDPLTKIPGWRMFRIDGIKNINIGGGDKIETARPNYNPKDKDMVIIYKAIVFDDDNEAETVTNNKVKPEQDKSQPSKDIDATSATPPKEEPTEPTKKDIKVSNRPEWVSNLLNRFRDAIKMKKK